jgi:hypothetical protein
MDTSVINSKDAKIIERLAREGKSIHDIRSRLKDRYTYEIIQAFMWERGCITLQGAKKAISLRTKKLAKTTKEDIRSQLANEIDGFVDYIYYAGKDTQNKLAKCRKRVADLKKLAEADE